MDLKEFLEEWNNDSDFITVFTSGSTGKPKQMLASKRKMENSARITCDFLGLVPDDTALLCMPLDYIAGKMVVVRSLVRKLKLVCVEPSGHPLKGLEEPPVFAAMVPMQVFNSLQVASECALLRNIRHLIIGGGAIDKALENKLRTFPNAVWSTYGMTETLSHIALRRLSGKSADCWYTPFKGVDISINTEGCLVIDAPSVCETRVVTNDIAEIASDEKRFRILGRRDNVIDSGGIKIQMEEIEQKLNGLLPCQYMITKRQDVKFGEIVVILVATDDTQPIRMICEKYLPKYWQPRLYVPVKEIPLTETGKPARSKAMELAKAANWRMRE